MPSFKQKKASGQISENSKESDSGPGINSQERYASLQKTVQLFQDASYNHAYRNSDQLRATYDKRRDRQIIHDFNSKLYSRLRNYQNDQSERNRIYHGVDLANVDMQKVQDEIRYDTQLLLSQNHTQQDAPTSFPGLPNQIQQYNFSQKTPYLTPNGSPEPSIENDYNPLDQSRLSVSMLPSINHSRNPSRITFNTHNNYLSKSALSSQKNINILNSNRSSMKYIDRLSSMYEDRMVDKNDKESGLRAKLNNTEQGIQRLMFSYSGLKKEKLEKFDEELEALNITQKSIKMDLIEKQKKKNHQMDIMMQLYKPQIRPKIDLPKKSPRKVRETAWLKSQRSQKIIT